VSSAQEGLFWPMMLLGATTLVVIGVGVAIRDQTGQRVEDLEVLSTDLLVGSWWERDSMEDGDPTSDLVDHSEDFDSGVYSFQNGGVDGSSAG